MVSDMKLIGVDHRERCVGPVYDYLSQIYPQGPSSLMLELPSNWPEICHFYSANFFTSLERKYDGSGTRIIYGDKALYLPKSKKSLSFWKPILKFKYKFDTFMHRRDRVIARTIIDQNPEVVIVGLYHANYLKKRFPEAEYHAVVPVEILNGSLRVRKKYKEEVKILADKIAPFVLFG